MSEAETLEIAKGHSCPKCGQMVATTQVKGNWLLEDGTYQSCLACDWYDRVAIHPREPMKEEFER